MITNIPYHGHEEWLSIRRQYIGGSDAGAVVGLDDYCSPYSLWAQKTGKIPEFSGNITTRVGAYLEKLVADMFTEKTGKKVHKHNFTVVNDVYPWACANVDRLIIGEKSLLEIKTTNSLPTMKQCKNGEFPARWYCQVTHYMAVTGLEKAYIAVLLKCNDFMMFEIDRDESEIDALMSAEKAFWKCVQTDTPPVIDGMEATTESIRAIFPESNGNDINLLGYDPYIHQYISISSKIKELESLRNEAANSIKTFMRETETGYTDKYNVYWKSCNRLTFDWKKFAEDHKDMDLSPYYKTSTTRPFKVIEK